MQQTNKTATQRISLQSSWGIRILIVLLLCSVGVALYGYQKRVQQTAALETVLQLQFSSVRDAHSRIERAELSAEYQSVVRSCSSDRQTQFDSLLNRLDRLSASELDRVDDLFSLCADTFAVSRLVTVEVLAQELRHAESLVTAFPQSSQKSTYESELAIWNETYQLEKQRAAEVMRLVTLQGDIIAALQNGARPSDDSIAQILETVTETRTAIDSLRAQITESLQRLKTTTVGT